MSSLAVSPVNNTRILLNPPPPPPACNRGLASIGTSESDPQCVCEVWLLSEVLQYSQNDILLRFPAHLENNEYERKFQAMYLRKCGFYVLRIICICITESKRLKWMSVKVLCDKHFIKWLSVSEKYGPNYLQSTCSEDTFNEIVIDRWCAFDHYADISQHCNCSRCRGEEDPTKNYIVVASQMCHGIISIVDCPVYIAVSKEYLMNR